MQVHRRAHTHAHTHTHTHTHIHIHTHTHTTHANIHIYTHTHSNTKVPCTRASARHTHEHTFTLMYITHNHTEARTSHEQEEARITGLHVLALGLHVCSSLPHVKGWPEPYVYTIYDCIFGDFPAKSTVYIHHIYGSGHPYSRGMLRIAALSAIQGQGLQRFVPLGKRPRPAPSSEAAKSTTQQQP
jgi:hypothetical protein